MKKENEERAKGKKNKKYSIKKYIRDFLVFIEKNIIKTTKILIVVSILLIAIITPFVIKDVMAADCVGTCRDEMAFREEYGSKMQILLITFIAGIVPYIYAPVIGYVGYIISEVATIAYIIKGYGYLIGILFGIIPLAINILIICIITAAGIYICSNITMGYRMSNIKNMNFTNFRIKLYETLGNEKKVESLTKARDNKIEKLQSRKEDIDFLQLLNIAIVIGIMQFIATAIQEIIL